MTGAWERFFARRAAAAARAVQRHIASGERRRERRAWIRCALWTRLEVLARSPES